MNGCIVLVIDSLCGQSGGWMDGKCKFEIVRMDG